MGGFDRHRRRQSRRASAPWLLSLLAVVGLVVSAPPAAASPVPTAPVDPSATLAQVAPSVVDIRTTLGYQGATATGAGIVLSPDGEVLTNNHVVEGATEIAAFNPGTGRTFSADVLGFDRGRDIALLRLRGANDLRPAALGDSSQVAVGDPVVAVGNADGVTEITSAAPGSVTALNQTVTATSELGGDRRELTGLIQIAADLRPGDSGGPLVNESGQVIGVNTAASANYRLESGGQGFAIPIGQALPIAGQIRSGAGSSTVHIGDTAFLGIGVASGASPAGARVSQVLAGTPAEQIGLAGGDLIVSVDGIAIDSPTTLTNVFDQRQPGDTIELSWIDGAGTPRTANVTLVKGPAG